MSRVREVSSELRTLLYADLYTRVGPNGEGGEVWEDPTGAVRVVITPDYDLDVVECLVFAGVRERFTGDADAEWLDEVLP